MQNNKIDLINIQHKCIVVIEKPKYMINNIFTWIKTAIKTGKLKADTAIGSNVEIGDNVDITKISSETIFELKKELAKETRLRLYPYLRSNSNKKGVLIDPLQYCLDVPYCIIGDNFDEFNYEDRNYIADKYKHYANDRITSCSVSQEIGGNWTANITLNNTDNIYTLDNIYYYNGNTVNTNLGEYVLNQNNTCVIEPNDEVTILMSDWEGKFNCVFTGLVSGVSLQDDGLNKSVNLTCDDMLKKLTWHNFNSQPSFDILESQGEITSVYKDSYMHLSVERVLQTLLGDTFCDLYKNDDFLARIAKSYYTYYQYKDDKQKNKQAYDALCAIPSMIRDEIDGYIQPSIMDNGIKVMMDKAGLTASKTEIICGYVGYKATINYKELFEKHKANPTEKYIRTPFYKDRFNGDVAFEISGMEQPAWSWVISNGWDFLFSHYEKNSEVIARIKGVTQYEFFADAMGVVKYRPPNFTLPRTNALSDISAEDIKRYDDYITKNYWVTQDLEKYFINFNDTVNDNKIFTRVNVKGQWEELAITYPTLGSYIEAPTWYTNKYGTRFMTDQMRVGLTSKEACQAYGELLLWKNNINYELATANCILNSNYTVGQPIYTERFLAVWYIGRVEHNFTSGGNCTTSLTLTYKRTPLCYRKDIGQYLANEQEYGKLSETEVKYIKKNLDLLTWGKIEIEGMPTPTNANLNANLSVEEKLAQTFSKSRNELDLVWQPLPADLYPLALELQKQVSLTNEIINNNVTTTKKFAEKQIKENGKDLTYEDFKENEILSKEQYENRIQIQMSLSGEIRRQKPLESGKKVYNVVDQKVLPVLKKLGSDVQENMEESGQKKLELVKKVGKGIKKGLDYVFDPLRPNRL